MTRKAEPHEIDFGACGDWGYRVFVNTLDPLTFKGPTTFYYDTDGKLRYHTKPVPEFRMRRARRILWECRQHPDWARKPSMFFRHPSLRNVPYVVLKGLYEESETRNAQ